MNTRITSICYLYGGEVCKYVVGGGTEISDDGKILEVRQVLSNVPIFDVICENAILSIFTPVEVRSVKVEDDEPKRVLTEDFDSRLPGDDELDDDPDPLYGF